MTLKITKSYSAGCVEINRIQFKLAVLKAARRLDDADLRPDAVALLMSQDSTMEPEEVEVLLQALRDAELGQVRDYAIETDDFKKVFEAPAPVVSTALAPKLYVVIEGGVMRYVAATCPESAPEIILVDLDNDPASSDGAVAAELTRIW